MAFCSRFYSSFQFLVLFCWYSWIGRTVQVFCLGKNVKGVSRTTSWCFFSFCCVHQWPFRSEQISTFLCDFFSTLLITHRNGDKMKIKNSKLLHTWNLCLIRNVILLFLRASKIAIWFFSLKWRLLISKCNLILEVLTWLHHAWGVFFFSSMGKRSESLIIYANIRRGNAKEPGKSCRKRTCSR